MPWDPADHLGKDHYNRMHLPELIQQTKADVDDKQRALNDLIAQPNADDGAIYALQNQLAVQTSRLQGYQDEQATLNKSGPHWYLGQLDPWGHGAVAINDSDIAKRNAILVPGTGQDLTTMSGADNKSLAMYRAALDADHNLMPEDVAVTTWMGYDRPMHLGQADFPGPAQASAGNLDAFETGLRASHIGAPSIGTGPGGPAWPLGLPSIEAHSSYWSEENPALANTGTVIAGKPPPFPYAWERR